MPSHSNLSRREILGATVGMLPLGGSGGARFITAVATASLAASASGAVEQALRNIGSRRELFVDDFLIERMQGTRQMLHQPVDAGTVLHFNQPWEGPYCAYCTVIKDGPTYRL